MAAAQAVVCCIVAFTCIIAVVDLGLSIAEICMGAIHLQDCPVQSKIPIYLLVAGGTGFILAISNLFKAKKNKSDSQRREAEQQSKAAKCANSIVSLLSLFAFVWLICGTVWVFSISPTFQQPRDLRNDTVSTAIALPSGDDAASSTYCYEPLYKFAMATVLLRYAVLILYIFLICCTCCACCGVAIGVMCCAKCLADSEDVDGSVEQQGQDVSMVEKS